MSSPPAQSDAPARLVPAARLVGEVSVPSDKSIAHRALICAALADGESEIGLRLAGDDVLSTIGALRALGVALDLEGDEDALTVRVRGSGSPGEIGRLVGGRADCGNSGTAMRLLAGALAAGEGRSVLTGDRSLSRRPMERLAAPLRAMGADIQPTAGHAPLVIHGRRPLIATDHRLPVASAQLLGAVSLAALAAEGTTTIHLPGPTRDHTERMLAGLGAHIERVPAEGVPGATRTTIDGPGGLRAASLSVPGDFSSAAAWLVAATIHPDAEVRLFGVGLNPTRTALLDVLREMGADIEVQAVAERAGEPVGEVVVRSAARLEAVSLNADRVPALIDELPLLAVAMAAAEGVSEVRGAAELRVKESDRVATMAAALAAIGAGVEELPDGWRISRGTPRSAEIATAGDHRVAMALAVAAWSGVAAGVTLDDADCVAVSYPAFWHDAAALGLMT